MAPVSYGECKVNITSRERNSREESQNRGLVKKVSLNPVNIKVRIVACLKKIWEVGEEDPKRVVHAMKVGLALSLVSLLCFLDPLFSGVGENAIWAVMTVVVVLEFTAGATLSKGVNRGIGTLVAGSLGFLVSYLAEQIVQVGEAIIIGSSLFVIGAIATYARFFPFIKRRYDYGVLIFLLTFSMITVSGYRVENIFRMAYERLFTIFIGCVICVITSLLISPIWAGETLHKSTVKKFEGLAKSLEGCIHEYFDGRRDEMDEDETDRTPEDAVYEGYKSVLDSKATDESLATFAGWEPRHGRFRYRHPWKQYVKIGMKLRFLAYSIVALHGCLRSEIQTQHSVRSVLKKPCSNVSEEAAKLLREMSSSIKHMRRCDSESMMKQLKLALKDLQAALHSQPKLLIDSKRWPIHKIVENRSEIEEPEDEELGCGKHRKAKEFKKLVSWNGERKDRNNETQTQPHCHTLPLCANCIDEKRMSRQTVKFAEALPLATFAWLLVEIVARLQHVVEAVDELARLADFEAGKPCSNQQVKRTPLTPSHSPNLWRLRRSTESHATSNNYAV